MCLLRVYIARLVLCDLGFKKFTRFKIQLLFGEYELKIELIGRRRYAEGRFGEMMTARLLSSHRR